MKKFAEEFKKFIMRGNVMDMAVGVIIGGAFGAITTSLVTNVITPLLAAMFQSPNPDALNFTLRAADEAAGTEAIVLGLGTFLGTIINFLVIALALFAVIKAINRPRPRSRPSPRPRSCSPPSSRSSKRRNKREAKREKASVPERDRSFFERGTKPAGCCCEAARRGDLLFFCQFAGGRLRNAPALPQLPFPVLLRDGPPMARLRSGEAAFFCPRQPPMARLRSGEAAFFCPRQRRRSPPPYLSFRCLPEKKDSAAPGGRKKRALARGFPADKR